MAKLTRYDFLGSWIVFWLLCIFIITIPIAIIYLINKTISVEYETEDADNLLTQWKRGKISR